MLTRREILIQLKTLGVTQAAQLKLHCRDFERYMRKNYPLESKSPDNRWSWASRKSPGLTRG